MSRGEAIRDHLPALYRPEENDTGSLLSAFVRVTGELLDKANRDATAVMRSHWFAFADRALYDSYFLARRQDQKLPSPAFDKPSLAEFGGILDLGRLAALFDLGPWREPSNLREAVEAYRSRIARTVEIYRNGLGTVGAVRGIVEAMLPPVSGQGHITDRPFSIEELVPLAKGATQKAQGTFGDVAGPLMRWTVKRNGVRSVSPTLFVEGIAPVAGQREATRDPLVELFSVDGRLVRSGIGYRGTIGPGQALRFRPAFMPWIGVDDGLLRGTNSPTDDDQACSSPVGAFEALPDGPTSATKVLLQTRDRYLYAATADGELWRIGQVGAVKVAEDLGQVHCLAETPLNLLIGTEAGMWQLPLFPADESERIASATGVLVGQKVQVLFSAADGTRWVGTEQGLFTLSITRNAAGDEVYTVEPFVLRADRSTGVSVLAMAQDQTGNLFFGTALGLFQHQAGSGHWYWYEGRARSDDEPDWQRFDPAGASPEAINFPSESDVYLPPVTCLHRGPDASLWLGTTHGIARYLAQSSDGPAYRTLLQAFPDLTTGRVSQIFQDERQNLWFCTEHGLFRYDGRDFGQWQEGRVRTIGRADTLYRKPAAPRGAFRFNRDESAWQNLDDDDQTTAPIATVESAVYAVAVTDHVVADTGAWDGCTFSAPAPVAPHLLVARYKPDELSIVSGGLPAIPRQPVGEATWRYLALEAEDLVIPPAQQPCWTSEGRLCQGPERSAAYPGQMGEQEPPAHLESHFDDVVFAYPPAARVYFQQYEERLLTALVRLGRLAPGESIDPAILDRVKKGIEQVRPAGVTVMLAVEQDD